MDKSDFEKIVLTDSERKLFNAIKKSEGIELHCEDAGTLEGMRLVQTGIASTDEYGYSTSDCIYKISKDGERFDAYRKHKRNLLLIKSVWIPIAVSFTTTVLTTKILPLLLHWLKSLLSQ